VGASRPTFATGSIRGPLFITRQAYIDVLAK